MLKCFCLLFCLTITSAFANPTADFINSRFADFLPAVDENLKPLPDQIKGASISTSATDPTMTTYNTSRGVIVRQEYANGKTQSLFKYYVSPFNDSFFGADFIRFTSTNKIDSLTRCRPHLHGCATVDRSVCEQLSKANKLIEQKINQCKDVLAQLGDWFEQTSEKQTANLETMKLQGKEMPEDLQQMGPAGTIKYAGMMVQKIEQMNSLCSDLTVFKNEADQGNKAAGSKTKKN